MRETEVIVAGGGLAGSVAVAMLARAGFDTALIDPHETYPPDLRCEKLDGAQVRILDRTGLSPAVLPAATYDRQSWVAKFGRVVEKRSGDQYGILYDTLVNTVRAAIPANAVRITGKVQQISLSSTAQTVSLFSGEEIRGRLVVLATGLNSALRSSLGIQRRDLSKCHSITVAFDLVPVGRSSFEFPALTYYTESTRHRTAYITLFPIGSTMRANLMVYRAMDDPWFAMLREHPEQALLSIMPRLSTLLGRFQVTGRLIIRPADLYAVDGFLQPGLVLVGDAFGTSCPAAGTGTSKVFTDVERLCNVYVPKWMPSPGMGIDKVAAFYKDPLKLACDRQSLRKAYRLRALSIDEGLYWRAERWGRFLGRVAIGTVRQAVGRRRPRSSADAKSNVPAAASD